MCDLPSNIRRLSCSSIGWKTFSSDELVSDRGLCVTVAASSTTYIASKNDLRPRGQRAKAMKSDRDGQGRIAHTNLKDGTTSSELRTSVCVSASVASFVPSL